VGGGAEADPARLAQGFESSRDVDPVAEDVAVLDDDVTDIDAHAEFDAAPRRHRGVAGDHLALHLDRAPHRVDDTGELDEETVAGGFDDAAAMLGDLGIAELAPNRL
jgi:hypothetical protein